MDRINKNKEQLTSLTAAPSRLLLFRESLCLVPFLRNSIRMNLPRLLSSHPDPSFILFAYTCVTARAWLICVKAISNICHLSHSYLFPWVRPYADASKIPLNYKCTCFMIRHDGAGADWRVFVLSSDLLAFERFEAYGGFAVESLPQGIPLTMQGRVACRKPHCSSLII